MLREGRGIEMVPTNHRERDGARTQHNGLHNLHAHDPVKAAGDDVKTRDTENQHRADEWAERQKHRAKFPHPDRAIAEQRRDGENRREVEHDDHLVEHGKLHMSASIRAPATRSRIDARQSQRASTMSIRLLNEWSADLSGPLWDMLVDRASSGRKIPCRERDRICEMDH